MAWLDATPSLAAQLQLEAARRAIPRLHRHELEARLDTSLCQLVTLEILLRQALGRVQMLELQAALGPSAAPRSDHHEWAAALLADLATESAGGSDPAGPTCQPCPE
jgi:hypothetical protein